MIIGISFEVPNKWYPVIDLILKDINIKKYFWILTSDDVVGNNGSNGYFEKDRYPGNEFEQAIKEENCYAISMTLQAYLQEDDITKIDNYQDFVESKCEFILLIDDNSYISVFSKDPEVVDTIYKSAVFNGFENIELITAENELLKRFYV